MILRLLLILLLFTTPAYAQHVAGAGLTAKTCSGTDKFSAVTSSGTFTCSADQTGAGGGDAIQVEDGDNAGTFTAATDVDFEDSSDINFVLNTATSPDQISATIRANSVALSTDTTGNYVLDVADGTGIDGTAAAEGATYTPSLDLTEITCGAGISCPAATTITAASSEADFLTSGALTCGAGTQGKTQVHTTPLQYCDNAATPALQYAAYGNSSGECTAAANNSVALTTDTTGNYVASITNGSGISGGDGGSEGAALTLAATLGTDIVTGEIVDATITQADIDDTATLAANPANGDSSVWFATTGLIFEGATSNTNEGLLISADVGSDVTWTLPNETGTICTTGSVCTGYQAGPLAGDVVTSGTTATIQANSVALTTDTTGNYVASITNGSGISGGDGGSEGAALTIAATLGTDIVTGEIVDGTIAYADVDATATLAGNPANGNSSVWFATTGLIFEGSTSDTFESLITVTDPTADRTFTIPNADSNPVQPLTCSGTDKVSAIAATGAITCSADETGAGGGDAIQVEDGDNAGTFTAATDVDFEDSGDINFALNTATSPDQISATIRADSVALTTDTTGNYVQDVADGTGIDGTASGEGATYTPSLDLTEITCGTGLVCGSATAINLDYADTLAGNPAFNAEECVFTTDGTGGGGFLCEGNAGGNTNEQLHLFAAADGADTTDFIATASAAVTDAIGAATTNTLTNKTLDVEGTGNSITTVSKLWLPVAQCQNTTAGILWDYETANSPAAACVTGTNTQKGVADFDATTDECLQMHVQLPADFSGNIDVRYVWLASATTGSVGWCSQLVSTADAETDDPAFPAQGAGNCVSDAAKGTTLQVNQADDTSITATGVAAGELLHIRLCRDANGGAVTDDMTGDARLIGVEYTFRRAQ